MKQKKMKWTDLAETFGYEGIVRNMGILLIVVVFFILNIFISHYAENSIREINKKSVELKQLRWKYIDEKSKLMFMTKESELAKKSAGIGLSVLTSPPSKIEINHKKD